ncbi:uncharacterized protein LOC127877483 [Dreissena polymorpha]|uniref:uncharacterized protein LOC127877483 n=1 Tax=Dreissena polymorpha TaxID=45954 RepID=UPI002263D240|nr:uncharacterized protein LOC127877483 [Dreissena polymorpha]
MAGIANSASQLSVTSFVSNCKGACILTYVIAVFENERVTLQALLTKYLKIGAILIKKAIWQLPYLYRMWIDAWWSSGNPLDYQFKRFKNQIPVQAVGFSDTASVFPIKLDLKCTAVHLERSETIPSYTKPGSFDFKFGMASQILKPRDKLTFGPKAPEISPKLRTLQDIITKSSTFEKVDIIAKCI